ncbi:MAG: hypothetical protein CSB33_04185 [Desulfobacterales bacterium]|nr:MAG: hypothetical protein CSB33_04185 [Desulfobacterales bacterium]
MSMFRLIRLEERIVLDGAAMLDFLDHAQDQDAHDQAMQDALQNGQDGNDGDDGPGLDANEPLFADALDMAAPEDEGLRVLVVSSDVTDADDLAAAARDDVLVIRYNAAGTSLEDLSGLISDALDGRKADSIAFASHNAGGAEVALTGDAVTNLDTLTDEAQQDFWAGIGAQVAEGGRIDILACDVASGEGGEDFLAALEDASGRNVSASTDATGNEAYGGDWVMESDGVDVQRTYFNADRLEDFDGLLLAGEDPDFKWNAPTDTPDRHYTIHFPKANTYYFVPETLWMNDDPANITVSLTGKPSWHFSYSNASDKLSVYAAYLSKNSSHELEFTAYDGVNTDVKKLGIIVDNNAGRNEFRGAGIATPAVPENGGSSWSDSQLADSDAEAYKIVSGNPNGGSGPAFTIDNAGTISVWHADSIQYDDKYIDDGHIYNLVVEKQDFGAGGSSGGGDDSYIYYPVAIPVTQMAATYEVHLEYAGVQGISEVGTHTATQVKVEVVSDPANRPLTDDVTVTLETGGTATVNSDYTVSPLVVTLGPGQSSSLIDIAALQDADPNEPDETVTLHVSGINAIGSDSVSDASVDRTITISESKPTLTLSVDTPTIAEGGSATLTAFLDITADTKQVIELDFTDGGTTIPPATPDGDPDYVASSAFLTIEAGSKTSSNSITLDALADNIAEGGTETKSISVVPDASFNAGPIQITISDTEVNDPPEIVVSATPADISEGESAVITVTRQAPASGDPLDTTNPLTVSLSYGGDADQGVDYNAPDTVVIPAGEISVTVDLAAVLDSVPDGFAGVTADESVVVTVVDQVDYNLGGTATAGVLIKDVDPPIVDPAVEIEVVTASVAEGYDSAFRISRNNTTGNLNVYLDFDGAAVEGTDYTASDNLQKSGSNTWVEIPDGQSEAIVGINTLTDSVPDGDETLTATIVAAGSYATSDATDDATLTIIDADADPVVEMSWMAGTPIMTEGESGLDRARIVVRDAAGNPISSHGEILVTLSGSGEAVFGQDYGLTDLTENVVTIPDGSDSVNFFVRAGGNDHYIESVEDFTMSIASVSNAVTSGSYADEVSGEIHDFAGTPDPAVAISIDPEGVYESTGSVPNEAAVQVDITAPAGYTYAAGSTVEVNITGSGAATPGDDYELIGVNGGDAGPWTLGVPVQADATQGSATFTLAGLPDEIADVPTEGLILTANVGIESDSADGMITDNPAPGGPLTVTMNMTPNGGALIAEDGGIADIQLDLSRKFLGNLDARFTVGGDATPGEDYQIWFDGATVPFAGGEFTINNMDGAIQEHHVTIVAGNAKNWYEGDESIEINLVEVTSPGVPDITEVSSLSSVLIDDEEEMPAVSISFEGADSVTLNEEASPADSVQIIATADTPSQNPLTVPLDFSGAATYGVDYTAPDAILIGSGMMTGSAKLEVIPDSVFENGAEDFTVAVSIGALSGVTAGAQTAIDGVITEDDIQGPIEASIVWDGDTSAPEGGALTVDVLLTYSSAEDTVVSLNFGGGTAGLTTDYTVAGADGAGNMDVTVPAGATMTTVQVALIDDTANEPAENFNVRITGIDGGANGDALPAIIDTAMDEITGLIEDTDNGPGVYASLDNDVISEGDTATLKVTLDAQTFEEVVITVGLSDGLMGNRDGKAQLFDLGDKADYVIAPADGGVPGADYALVTINPGVTEAVIPILTYDEDGNDEGWEMEETATFTFASDQDVTVKADPLKLTIQDNDEKPRFSLELNDAVSNAKALIENPANDDPANGLYNVITLDLNLVATDSIMNSPLTVDIDFDGLITAGADQDVTVGVIGLELGMDSTWSGDHLLISGIDPNNDKTFTLQLQGVSENAPDDNHIAGIKIAGVTDSYGYELTNEGLIDADADTVTLDVQNDDFAAFARISFSNNTGATGKTLEEDKLVPMIKDDYGTLSVSLVNDSGAPYSMGTDAAVTIELGGEATWSDFGIYESPDDTFNNSHIINPADGQLVVTIPAGETIAHFGIQAIDADDLPDGGFGDDTEAGDGIYEGNEIGYFTVGNSDKVGPASTGSVESITVLDDDTEPIVTVKLSSPADGEISEAADETGTAEFELKVMEGLTATEVTTPLTLEFGGEADFGTDYTIASFSDEISSHTITGNQLIMTVGPGHLMDGVTFGVVAIEDSSLGVDERIEVTLLDGNHYTTDDSLDTAVVTIMDDDGEIGDISVSIAPVGASFMSTEGDISVNAAVVSLGGAAGLESPVIVEVEMTGDGAYGAEAADFTVGDGVATHALDAENTFNITFDPGTSMITLGVTAGDDAFWEPSEGLEISLKAATIGAHTLANVDTDTVTGLIIENDPKPTVSLAFGDSDLTEPEGGTPWSTDLTVTLTGSIGYDETITLALDDLGSGNTADMADISADMLGPNFRIDGEHLIVTIPAGETSVVTSIGVVDDSYTLGEAPEETFGLVVTGAEFVATGPSASVIIHDAPNDGASAVSIGFDRNGVDITDVTEGDSGTLRLWAERAFTRDTDVTLTIDLEPGASITNLPIPGGTEDFVSENPVIITIPANQTMGYASVAVVDDNIFENDETVTATVSELGGGLTTQGGDGAATLIIHDELGDKPEVSLKLADMTFTEDAMGAAVSEGVNAIKVTLELTNAADGTVGVDLDFTGAAIEGGDAATLADAYITMGGVSHDLSATEHFTIDPGETQVSFYLMASQDDVREMPEGLKIEFDAATAEMDSNVTLAAVADASAYTATIMDDSPYPALSITGVAMDFTEGDAPAAFTVELDAPDAYEQIITLDFGGDAVSADFTADVADAIAGGPGFTIGDVQADGTVTLAIGAGETLATVSLYGVYDGEVETDESVTLTVDPGVFTEGSSMAQMFTLHDFGRPELILTAADGDFTEGVVASNIPFTVGLSFPNQLGEEIFTLDFDGNATAGTDFTLGTAVTGVTIGAVDADGDYPVTFGPGVTQAEFFLQGVYDTETEVTESVQMTLTSDLLDVAGATSAEYTLHDFDRPEVSFSSDLIPGLEEEGAGMGAATQGAIHVVLSASNPNAAETVTIDFGAVNPGSDLPSKADYGDDFIVKDASSNIEVVTNHDDNTLVITFPAGEDTATITLGSVNDGVWEMGTIPPKPEDIYGELVVGSEGLQLGSTTHANGSLHDNGIGDIPYLMFTAGDDSFNENGDSLTVTAKLLTDQGAAFTKPHDTVWVALKYDEGSIAGTATETDYEIAEMQNGTYVGMEDTYRVFSIPADQNSVSLTLTGLDDMTYEGAETLVLNLNAAKLADKIFDADVTNPVAAGLPVFTATITDNDAAPLIGFEVGDGAGDYTVDEGGGTIPVTIQLYNQDGTEMTVADGVTETVYLTLGSTGIDGEATYWAGSVTGGSDTAVYTAGEDYVLTNNPANGGNNRPEPGDVGDGTHGKLEPHAGGHYAFPVTIPANQTQVNVYLHALDDSAGFYGEGGAESVTPSIEGDEIVQIGITDLAGTTESIYMGDGQTSRILPEDQGVTETVTIMDDEAAPTVSLIDISDATEGEQGIITLKVSGLTTGGVNMILADFDLDGARGVTGDMDFNSIAVTGAGNVNVVTPQPELGKFSLQILEAATDGTIKLTFDAVADGFYEGDEPVVLTLEDANAYDDDLNPMVTDIGTQEDGAVFHDSLDFTVGVDVNDWDDAGTWMTGEVATEDATGIPLPDVSFGSQEIFTVTLSNPAYADTHVTLNAGGSADFTDDIAFGQSFVVTVPAGETSANLPKLGIYADDIDESDETVTLDIASAWIGASATDAPDAMTIGAGMFENGVLTIADNDFTPDKVSLSDGAPAGTEDFSVSEDLTAVIMPDNLTFTDGDHLPDDVLYTVVTLPEQGDLELDGTALTVGAVFSQGAVDAGRLAYDHGGDANDASETVDEDSFSFTVADVAGNTYTAGGTEIVSFHIDIATADDPPQVDRYKVFYAMENSTADVDIRDENHWTAGYVAQSILAVDIDTATSVMTWDIGSGGEAFKVVAEPTAGGEGSVLSLELSAPLDYEVQNAHFFQVTIDDGTNTEVVDVAVKVVDDPLDGDNNPTATDLPDATLTTWMEDWVYALDPAYFPSGKDAFSNFRTYEAEVEVNGGSSYTDLPSWLDFEGATSTPYFAYNYDPAAAAPTGYESTYEIRVTATYWGWIDEFTGQPTTVSSNFTLNIQASADAVMMDALDYLYQAEEVMLPDTGEAVEMLDMMAAEEAPQDQMAASREAGGAVFDQVLALLENDGKGVA